MTTSWWDTFWLIYGAHGPGAFFDQIFFRIVKFILLNSSCLSEVQCFDLVAFWSEVNQKLVQPNHLQSVHVKILLRNLYDNLTDSYKQRLCENKPIVTNIKLWTALGLHRFNGGTSDIMDLNVKIDSLCKAFSAERSVSVLTKLVSMLDAPKGSRGRYFVP